MEFKISIKINVDPDAAFLEVGDTNNKEAITELFTDFIYDFDDITLEEVEVEV